MGSLTSSLVKEDEGEIAAFVQRDGDCCGLFQRGTSTGIFREPAHFNDPKPYHLHRVSDDHWAALKLRVDPLARKILDPHRSIACLTFLCFLILLVYSAISPNIITTVDEADDNYYDENDDKSVENEYLYRETELRIRLVYWRIGLGIIVAILFVVTTNITMGMKRRNKNYDERISEVCGEMCPRFESEGYTVKYRTNQYGVCWCIVRPKRVVVFQKITDEEDRGFNVGDSLGHNNSSGLCNNQQRFGTIFVRVPLFLGPGKIMTVTTPSGNELHVSVPKGLKPGDQFPVQVPHSMIPKEQTIV